MSWLQLSLVALPHRRIALLRIMQFSHVGLRPVIYPSKLSSGLLYCLVLPFKLDPEILQAFLEALHSIILLFKGVALTPEYLPKYRPPR